MLDATRACELLVGLPAVNVLDVAEPLAGRLEITVESSQSLFDSTLSLYAGGCMRKSSQLTDWTSFKFGALPSANFGKSE